MTGTKAVPADAEEWVRPDWANVNEDRGGPHFGDFVDLIRGVMDAARFVNPTDDLARELVADLSAITAKMKTAIVPAAEAAGDTRSDLPARGNVALPPYTMLAAGPAGVEADAHFRPFHIGEGAVHGGNVSLLFDELAGTAVMYRVTTGFPRTAYLKVDYRSLTPLGPTLRAKVWVDRVEGRKLFVRGSLHDGATLCAEMEALFIEVSLPPSLAST